MSPDEEIRLRALLQEEKAGWGELETLVQSLSPEQAEITGYLPGWSVKDFLAHLAGWLAAAGRALEQIKSGTFVADDVDVDSRNEIYVDANRDQPMSLVLFELKPPPFAQISTWARRGARGMGGFSSQGRARALCRTSATSPTVGGSIAL